jgi:hypothetical protein
MLSTSTTLVVGASILSLVVACDHSLSENERKVVGTWDRTGMDHNERTVYRADRTFESEMSDGNGTHPFSWGAWRVEGNVLVEEANFHWEPIPGETPFPKKTLRIPILEFRQDKLVREPGRPPLIRVK